MIKKAKRLDQVSEYYFSRKLEQIASMRACGKEVINLGIGSPDMVPEASVISSLKEAASHKDNHAYQPYRSTTELREAIGHYYRQLYNVVLDPRKEVLPLLGSKEGIMYVSLAFLNPGDEVLVPNPGYPAYAACARLVGARVRHYDLLEETSWTPDFNGLRKMNLTSVKLMWVNYPNMPTGATVELKLFESLVSFAYENDILLCNNNPYSQVLNDSPLSLLSADPEKRRALELNSLSKSFNMAGWRVGMLLGHKEYIDAVIQVKSNVDSGMFRPVQVAASKALELPQEWHTERNATYAKRRKKGFELLDILDCTYSDNQAGMFIWAKVSPVVGNTHEFIDRLLNEAQIFITPGDIFGTKGRGYIRISLCASNDLYDRAIERVKTWEKRKKQLV